MSKYAVFAESGTGDSGRKEPLDHGVGVPEFLEIKGQPALEEGEADRERHEDLQLIAQRLRHDNSNPLRTAGDPGQQKYDDGMNGERVSEDYLFSSGT